MKKNIIIFGANGNVGKYIIPLLKKKNFVYFPTSTECDLKNSSSINKFFNQLPDKKYIILYLATKVSKNKENIHNYKANVVMLKNLLKEFKNFNLEKFIYFSTVDIYQKNKSIKIIHEISRKQPDSLYAKSKFINENLLIKNIYKKKLLIFRMPGIYGCQLNSFINDIKSKIISKRKIVIYNNGENYRDFLHIKDLSKIICLFVKTKFSGIFNISTGKSLSIMEIVLLIKKKYNSDSKIILKKKLHRNSNYNLFISNKKIKKILKNFKFMDINKGIEN